MTGLPYIHDYGRSGGPIGITNTNSVAWDGLLNEIKGAHVQANLRNSLSRTTGLTRAAH